MTLQKKLQCDLIIEFLTGLQPKFPLPAGVEIMNPYTDEPGRVLASTFYKKFYNDDCKRIFIFGINPGRWGGGITGVPFTDPIKLEQQCGIPNTLSRKPELSADFIYQMIETYGGPGLFYKHYFITAVCPLGFTMQNKNLNYYDDKVLMSNASGFISDCIEKQIQALGTFDTCVCLGEGTNYKFLTQLNERHKYFKAIIPLAHPRFIMQYKRKSLGKYIEDYVSKLKMLRASVTH